MKPQPDPWLPTRYTLIARMKDLSDGSSWQEFFDLYGRLIYSVALRSGLSHVESEEVVQETVLSVAKKIHHFKADPTAGSFKAWLRRLIQWRIKDQVRKRRPEETDRVHRLPGYQAQAPSSTATEERIPDPAAGNFEAIWDREWQEQVTKVALERLKARVNAKHYQVFHMLEVHGSPVKVVAEAFGISEAQVHLIRYRLLETLREQSAQLQEELR